MRFLSSLCDLRFRPAWHHGLTSVATTCHGFAIEASKPRAIPNRRNPEFLAACDSCRRFATYASDLLGTTDSRPWLQPAMASPLKARDESGVLATPLPTVSGGDRRRKRYRTSRRRSMLCTAN